MLDDNLDTRQNSLKFSDRIDALSHLAGVAGAMALLAMISFVCFEVVSRWLFNEPTVWVNEYSSYLLIAVTFLGLAYAQKEKGHIQVELIIGWLSEIAQQKLNKVTLWIGLFFVVFAAWQMVSFNYQEYANNTRSWGILATRQWKPELVVSIGYGLFCLSILADINRSNKPMRSFRWWIVPIVFVGLSATLYALGAYPVSVNKGPLDWGSLSILCAFLVGIWAWSGIRTLLFFVIVVAVVDATEATFIYELRELLEGKAGRLFSERASDTQIKDLQTSMKQLSVALSATDLPNKIRETAHFYRVLLDGCGNPLLSDAISRLHAKIILLRASSISEPARVLQSLDEMEAIVSAMLERNPDAAEAACATHVRAARDAALSTLGK